MPKVTDYYDMLRVRRDATTEEISRAHRLMARKYHPDMPEGDSDYFSQINVAYDTLMDDTKRAAYDLDLRQTEQPAGWGTPPVGSQMPKNSRTMFTSPIPAQTPPQAPVETPAAPAPVTSATPSQKPQKPYNPYTTQEKVYNSIIFMVLGFIGFIIIGRVSGMSMADASSSTYSWFLTAGVLATPALLFRNKFTVALAVLSLAVGGVFGMATAVITPGFNFFQAVWASAAWFGIFYSTKKPTFFA